MSNEDHVCTRDDEFEKIADAHAVMLAQLAAIQVAVDAIASAFVDKDFIQHRIDQMAGIESKQNWKKLKQHITQGVVLAAVISLCLFVGNAVVSRFASVTLPAAAGGTK
jgi:hypothetical protein